LLQDTNQEAVEKPVSLSQDPVTESATHHLEDQDAQQEELM
jgi:hypothetical protein